MPNQMFSYQDQHDLETVDQPAPPAFVCSADTVVPPGASTVSLTLVEALCPPDLTAACFDSLPAAPDTTALPVDVAMMEAAHAHLPAAASDERVGPFPEVSSLRFGLSLEQFFLSAPTLPDENLLAVATVAVLSRPPIPRSGLP